MIVSALFSGNAARTNGAWNRLPRAVGDLSWPLMVQ